MRIRNWSKFQHFKDRRPPWVKLYRDLLDDYQWHELAGDHAKSLVMLFLIASERDGGELPDIKELAFRLRMPAPAVIATISALSHWVEHDDIAVISERYQNDVPEIEIEKEGETEKEGEEPPLSLLRDKGIAPVLVPAVAVTPEIVLPLTTQKTAARAQDLADLWNQAAHPSLARVMTVTNERARKARARLEERPSQAWWTQVIVRVNASDFCLGRRGNGWKADFDWLIANQTNAVKVMEGKYDNRKAGNAGGFDGLGGGGAQTPKHAGHLGTVPRLFGGVD